MATDSEMYSRDDMVRAFVAGAKYWFWTRESTTMFPTEREECERAAEEWLRRQAQQGKGGP